MINTLKEIQLDIRNLRDSDNHVCPQDIEQRRMGEGECSCEGYDAVVDKLDEIIEKINKENK